MRRGSIRTKTLSPRETALRTIITLLVMLAFGLQSYIAQTHIHTAPDTFAPYSKLAQQSGKDKQPDKFPANGDPANCPICQEIAHTGQFVAPTAAVLMLPTASVSIITLVADVVVPDRAPHACQSRAPPRN